MPTNKKIFNSKETYWDPLGSFLAIDTVKAEMEELNKKFKYHQKHFLKIRITYILLFLLGIFFLIAAFFLISKNENWGLLIFPSYLPLLFYDEYIHGLMTDLVKSALAKKQNWLYYPHSDNQRWKILKDYFPEILNRGDTDQEISDQFWGSIPQYNSSTSFWLAEFKYRVKRGKNYKEFKESILSVPFESRNKINLLIKPEGIRVLNSILGIKDVELESNEFNRLFYIGTNKKDIQKQRQVFEIINPAVMASLIDFRKKCGEFEALIRDDVFMVRFLKQHYQPKHTHFFKKVVLDERDINYFKERVLTILDFANKIQSQLD